MPYTAMRKPPASMKEGIDILESILGTELFRKYVHVLLTDRGAEFSAAEAMETLLVTVQGGQGYFTAILCSQGKKARWRTSI